MLKYRQNYDIKYDISVIDFFFISTNISISTSISIYIYKH